MPAVGQPWQPHAVHASTEVDSASTKGDGIGWLLKGWAQAAHRLDRKSSFPFAVLSGHLSDTWPQGQALISQDST